MLRSSAHLRTALSLVNGAPAERRGNVLVERERKDLVVRMAGFRECRPASDHRVGGCMLELLSMSKPAVTGVSVSVKRLTFARGRPR